MATDVTLRSSSQFTGSNPTFTLEARTSGGPPTTSTWTRDGVVNTSGISLEVDTDPQDHPSADNIAAYMRSRYISTLVVTGVSPGVYQYSASNRAMASPRTDSFNIEGMCTSGSTIIGKCSEPIRTGVCAFSGLHGVLEWSTGMKYWNGVTGMEWSEALEWACDHF